MKTSTETTPSSSPPLIAFGLLCITFQIEKALSLKIKSNAYTEGHSTDFRITSLTHALHLKKLEAF